MDGPSLDDLVPDFGPTPRPAPGPGPAAAAEAAASPYAGLDPTRYWRSGVTETHPLTVEGLYARRFAISPEDRIATAGSCFAQHIAAQLRGRGFRVLDLEPTPWGLDPDRARAFGYGIYSARFGNLYTARQLLELLREATAPDPPGPIVWERSGRFFDALRPGVEPEGLASPEEVAAHRRDHLARVREMFAATQVFVFTFGLTEAWRDRATGRTLPTAPGTIAGRFDPALYEFHNFTAEETLADYRAFRAELEALNPGVRHLVTVSPVPLTATAADAHVLVASTYSKSVLRAVAGQLAAECPDVDYFPSYEIITAPWSRGVFFEPNLRAVSPAGVAAVMRVFFAAHAPQAAAADPAGADADAAEAPAARRRRRRRRRRDKDGAARRGEAGKAGKDAGEDVACEEILLEAFAR